ncbi:AbfB domain-containing protein [Corynebacterium bovis]|uniref:AbfB domain-containing protein n=1 Tax=Corynebacterium bovis TaxID=36808 RepID=UPI000F63B45D|nr:AbfB domain-containing protein [Corynebacterium bovis]MDN8578875.1 AbfB domain-containing protein [Corynebacterium bovis]
MSPLHTSPSLHSTGRGGRRLRLVPRAVRPLLTAALAAVVALAVTVTGPGAPPAGAAAVTATAGDGGLVPRPCGADPVQVRVDSSDVPGLSVCYSLVRATGWVATGITGSYGVVNSLDVPVSVAFAMSDGAVFWQRTVPPGAVQSVDVDRRGSTVVELQVSPVDSPSGRGTASLVPGTGAPNLVTLRSAGRSRPGQSLRITWADVRTDALTRNSGFTDRLDASFEVVAGPARPGCVTLRSAAYPGVVLQAGSGSQVVATSTPDPARSTWCVSAVASPPTGVRLVSAADQRRALTVSRTGVVSTTTSRDGDTVWFVDPALARPGV